MMLRACPCPVRRAGAALVWVRARGAEQGWAAIMFRHSEAEVKRVKNVQFGVLGPEEESIPTRGDENSMLFQILISSRELIGLPPGP